MNFKPLLKLMLIGLLISSLVSAQTEDQLTADEAINIALSDPDISSWVAEEGAKTDEPYNNGGIWNVGFYTDYSYLMATVDDATAELINYDIVDNGTVVVEDNVTQAIAFVKNHQFLSDIDTSQFEWYGYIYNNFIQVYAYTYSSDYHWINARVSENDTSFQLDLFSSDLIFGNPELSETEIIAIAEGLEPVQQFLSEVEDYWFDIYLSYDVSTPEAYRYDLYYNSYGYAVYDNAAYADAAASDSGSQTSDAPISAPEDSAFRACGVYHWVNVAISDQGDVLDISGTTTATMSEEEVKAVILEDSNFSSWLSGLDDYQISVSYSGYGSHWVYIYSQNTADYGYATVNDTTGEITDSFIFVPIPAKLSESQVLAIMRDDSRVSSWISQVEYYKYSIYYDNQGSHYVYFYDPVLYQNYIWARVDDDTGNISDLSKNLINTKLSLSEIYGILADEKAGQFLLNYPDAKVYVYYSDYRYDVNYSSSSYQGTWYVYIYSPSVSEAWINLQIDDSTGSVISKEEHYPSVKPTRSVSAIRTMIEEQPEYEQFSNLVEDYYSYISYYDGIWYGSYSGSAENGTYYSYRTQIDDGSGNILNSTLEQYSYGCGIYYGYAYADDMAVGAPETASNSQPRTDEDRGILLAEALADAGSSSETSSEDVSVFGFELVAVGILIPIAVINRRKSVKA